MKMIGAVLRSLLNINTIWGLMILVVFLLCVAQHYLPTTTTIAASWLSEGENQVTIRTPGKDGEPQDTRFKLTLSDGGLQINSLDCEPQTERPWLVSAAPTGAGYLLKWDHAGHGDYAVAIGSQVIAKGKLVTLQSLTDAAFDYAKIGFDLALGLVASMVLLLGLMRVGEDAGIVQLVAKLFHPIIRFLFPDIPKDHPASGAILMNWTTTILGLGNAATPFGLKAMKELQSLNEHPDVASDSQVMLLAYNTAGFALIPTTLLAIRKSAGCGDPFEIIGTCMIAGAVATITAIVAVKLLGKLPMFSVRAALAEKPGAGPAIDPARGEDQ